MTAPKRPMIPLDRMRGHLIKLTKANRKVVSINTEISLWYVIGILDYLIKQRS